MRHFVPNADVGACGMDFFPPVRLYAIMMVLAPTATSSGLHHMIPPLCQRQAAFPCLPFDLAYHNPADLLESWDSAGFEPAWEEGSQLVTKMMNKVTGVAYCM